MGSERERKEGEIMTDETLKQYIVDYKPKGNREIQMAHFDGYDFTFLIHDGKAIGGVLDMNREPQIHVLEEYRGHGYGAGLLKKYLVENGLVGSNQYVYYYAETEDGENLIKRFSERNPEFKVIEVEERKHIILKDYRF
jgi:GNAT superfamily N-acetyltransferase